MLCLLLGAVVVHLVLHPGITPAGSLVQLLVTLGQLNRGGAGVAQPQLRPPQRPRRRHGA
jgi:hypothetical protein